jgi:tellurite methyltransferase
MGSHERIEGLAAYETLYQRGGRLFGPPLPKVARLFAEHAPTPARVLDLGCGQGRHALFAAGLGHDVVGVDVAPTGIAQMAADAASAGLTVRGVVGDVLEFRTPEPFDVVLLIQLLCHLPDDETRARLLGQLAGLVREGGLAVVVVRPGGRRVINAFFAENSNIWAIQSRGADWVCARRQPAQNPGT